MCYKCGTGNCDCDGKTRVFGWDEKGNFGVLADGKMEQKFSRLFYTNASENGDRESILKSYILELIEKIKLLIGG